MKKFNTILFTIISFLSLGCYTVLFYSNGKLVLQKSNMLIWTGVMIAVFITLILGFINIYDLNSIKKQNKKLTELLFKVVDKQNDLIEKQENIYKIVIKQDDIINNQEDLCDEVLEAIRNTREISLDVLNKIKKGDK